MIYHTILSFLLLIYTGTISGVRQPAHTFTLMINPAGNAHSTERLIDNTFERSITLQAAQTIKHTLEQRFPHILVILTRTPGHMVTTVQNAHFANSLNVNLFLSLHFYQETNTKPNLYIYHYSYNNEFAVKPSDFTFYRYDQSYFFNQTSCTKAASLLEQTWSKKPHSHQFTTHAPIKFPCSSLIGIISPAIALDIGIKHASDWHNYIQPLVDGIEAIARQTPHSIHISPHP